MEITEYLPVDFRTQMEAETLCGAEEIRLRVGQPLEILYADEKEKEIGLLTEAHMREVLNYLSGYSVYALEEELRQGYFTLEGGHRIGVSGRASYEKHGTSSCMKLLSCISGLNIRLAHEKKGCASVLIPWLYCGENVYHTFFFAPPGVGKTTYLRDCIRLLSKGNHLRAGKKVGVVDERSEIAACYRGIPQNDLSPHGCAGQLSEGTWNPYAASFHVPADHCSGRTGTSGGLCCGGRLCPVRGIDPWNHTCRQCLRGFAPPADGRTGSDPLTDAAHRSAERTGRAPDSHRI